MRRLIYMVREHVEGRKALLKKNAKKQAQSGNDLGERLCTDRLDELRLLGYVLDKYNAQTPEIEVQGEEDADPG